MRAREMVDSLMESATEKRAARAQATKAKDYVVVRG
jgi:hypothetical protein